MQIEISTKQSSAPELDALRKHTLFVNSSGYDRKYDQLFDAMLGPLALENLSMIPDASFERNADGQHALRLQVHIVGTLMSLGS